MGCSRATRSAARRWAAARFSTERFGVRRTSGAASCEAPPWATREAVEAARDSASSTWSGRWPASLGVQPSAATVRAISARRASGRCENSAMSRPSNVTDSASFLIFLPWHSEHSSLVRYWAARFLVLGLLALANVSST